MALGVGRKIKYTHCIFGPINPSAQQRANRILASLTVSLTTVTQHPLGPSRSRSGRLGGSRILPPWPPQL
jgi:hypothetical protein